MAKGILVAVYKKIHDPDKLKAYAADAGSAMASQGARFLARTGNVLRLDGLAPVRGVVAEFSSPEAAVAAYNSEEYQAAFKKLDGGVEREVFVLEALE